MSGIDPYSVIPYPCDVCGVPGTSIVRDEAGQRVGCAEHPVMSDRLVWWAPPDRDIPRWRRRIEDWIWRWRSRKWWRS